MLSERNTRAEMHYDEGIDNQRSNPWDLENLLPDEQVTFKAKSSFLNKNAKVPKD